MHCSVKKKKHDVSEALKMATNHALEDELRPDAEANRIIEDRDLMDIDIKELNKMLKERNVSKELAVGCTIGAEIYSQIL